MSAPITCPGDGSCCSIELTDTVENYLKSVFALTPEGSSASTAGIAERVGVTPASASTMLARLRRGGLVAQTGWGRVRLTEHGAVHARSVVRRHRLLETFLHRVLGLASEEVHAEAEVLEHGLSERVADLIDEALGRPGRDPHGAPIPAKETPR